MVFEERIRGFIHLGEVLRAFTVEHGSAGGQPSFAGYTERLNKSVVDSQEGNGWFTQNNILSALREISVLLERESLGRWLQKYQPLLNKRNGNKTVAVIMAGNIPAVGFHDLLCVLVSGNRLLGKLSSDDQYLLPVFADILKDLNPEWGDFIQFTSGIVRSFDAVIATGSNNSSHYFEYYFSKYPHIIRKSRNSVAVLTGDETAGELSGLAADVFRYFGLGCRNVSKIYVPSGYDFSPLKQAFSDYQSFLNHNKYRNNYDYLRAVYGLNNIPFTDTGSILMKEDTPVNSPVAVIHYEYYPDREKVIKDIRENLQQIQCIVCREDLQLATIRPGMTQQPELSDYADGIDTMQFLMGLAEAG
jgi:hypothetical protein